MDFIWLKHLIPDVLQNNKDLLFGNIRELYEFHKRTFLKELEKCTENPDLLAHCFINRKEDLQIYFKYHKNLPRARAIWQECQDCAYFGVCQRQLGHNLPLFKYLRGPSQRLMKYQMLLKGLLDLASPEDLEIDPGDLEGGVEKDGPQRTKDSALSAELQQALAVVEDLIKSCELAEGLAAVTGCPDDIGKLGKLLMQGPFNVWTIHKDRYKMKDFIRFKPSQRQIYLFERGIVFCKIRMEPSDQGFSPHYSFKKSMKLVTLSIRQVGRGSNKKFEIANRSGLEKYILQATSKEIRDCWFSEISKLLLEQENNIKGHGNLQFEANTRGSGVECVPWVETMRRASASKEEPVSRMPGMKGCCSGESIAMESGDGGEGAQVLAKDNSALSISGLFQLDDGYETCTCPAVLPESPRGEREERDGADRAASSTEERAAPCPGVRAAPAGETTGFPAKAEQARAGRRRPSSLDH